MEDKTLSAQLDALLESIAPQRVGEENERRVGGVVDEFLYRQPALIGPWPEFRQCLTRFVRLLENTVLRLPAGFKMSEDHDFGRAVRILIKRYGKEGEKAAFQIARTGAEGGLRAVLSAIASAMIQEYEENEIRARIDHWWRGLSTDQKLQAARDYAARYRQMVPGIDLDDKDGWRLIYNLPKTLLQHAAILRQMRQRR